VDFTTGIITGQDCNPEFPGIISALS